MNVRTTIRTDGDSQVITIPAELRLEGREVTIRRQGNGVAIEPVAAKKRDLDAWFAKLDKYRDEVFMPEGREQPDMPPDRAFFRE